MNLYFRLLATLLTGLLRPRQHPYDPALRAFRVLPHDLDAFGHMNNGRYLQLMDVARTQWMLQAGVLGAMRRARWGAVLGGNLIRYRYALNLFERFTVRTELLHWNKRWFFFEHRFIDSQGRTAALALSRAALRQNSRWVPTEEVVNAVAPGMDSLPLPDAVARWLEADAGVEGHRCAPATLSPTAPLEATP